MHSSLVGLLSCILMEGFQDNFGGMKFLAVEMEEIQITGSNNTVVTKPRATGRLLSDRPVQAKAFVQILGKIWCPLGGVLCKDLGENHFLFTFRHMSEKKRALEMDPGTL